MTVLTKINDVSADALMDAATTFISRLQSGQLPRNYPVWRGVKAKHLMVAERTLNHCIIIGGHAMESIATRIIGNRKLDDRARRVIGTIIEDRAVMIAGRIATYLGVKIPDSE